MTDVSSIQITGPLSLHAQGFWSDLLARGYTPLSSANLLRLMAHLSRWLDKNKLQLKDLTSEGVRRFLQHRRRRGYVSFLSRRALEPLLRYLQKVGVLLPFPKEREAETPLTLLLKEYRGYLDHERSLATSTASMYERTAYSFLSLFVGATANLGCLKADDVTTFILEESKSQSVGYAKLKVTALRSLLRYLYVRGQLSTNLGAAVPAIAGWRLASLPKAISKDEVQKLLKNCDRRTAVGRRDFAALLLMAYLGLRVSEVAALDLEAVCWTRGELIVKGKGCQEDRLPIPQQVGEALVAYLQKGRPLVGSRKLFLRSRAPYEPLSRSGITEIVFRACHRAGLTRIGAHRLRHTVATQMLRHGGSLSEIAQVLRHRSIDTTAIYAKVDRIALQEVTRPWVGGAA